MNIILQLTVICAALSVSIASGHTKGLPRAHSFGYIINDDHGEQYREESGVGGLAVRGSYGFTDDRGLYRRVKYVADHRGFRAQVLTNEPGTESQDPASVRMISRAGPDLLEGHGHETHWERDEPADDDHPPGDDNGERDDDGVSRTPEISGLEDQDAESESLRLTHGNTLAQIHPPKLSGYNFERPSQPQEYFDSELWHKLSEKDFPDIESREPNVGDGHRGLGRFRNDGWSPVGARKHR